MYWSPSYPSPWHSYCPELIQLHSPGWLQTSELGYSNSSRPDTGDEEYLGQAFLEKARLDGIYQILETGLWFWDNAKLRASCLTWEPKIPHQPRNQRHVNDQNRVIGYQMSSLSLWNSLRYKKNIVCFIKESKVECMKFCKVRLKFRDTISGATLAAKQRFESMATLLNTIGFRSLYPFVECTYVQGHIEKNL